VLLRCTSRNFGVKDGGAMTREPESAKIAIHHRPGSFSDRWIEYCKEHSIRYELVNCYQSNILQQLKSFDALLWHWHQHDAKAMLFARQLITSLHDRRIKVFPDLNTCWHFDDKVGQKYLLESIDAPLVPSYVFYDKDEALRWIKQADFPKVFKLRGGAGSKNVHLIRSRREAGVLCRQAFGRGLPAVAGYLTDMRSRIRKTKSSVQLWDKLRRAPFTILNILTLRRQMPRQRGYFYLQEFLPDNAYDTRITVIGDRAFGFLRMNRPGDFRASGSGTLVYDPSQIDPRCVQVAFQVADQLGSQSLAFDFLFDPQHEPVICEISYCYVASAVHACAGHWNRQGVWRQGHLWPQDAILRDVLIELNGSRQSRRGLC